MARRLADGGALQSVRNLLQDRLQDFRSHQECGVEGLTDRSRRPYRYANQLPFQVENFILNVKREHPSWGAREIRERLLRRFSEIPIPAKNTIHAVQDRYGLVERRRWSALWIMIWDTSIWRLGCSNRWKIHLAQKCYLCSRYILLPMSPGRTSPNWWSRWDSNPRPPRCHRGALPTAPRPHRQGNSQFTTFAFTCSRSKA